MDQAVQQQALPTDVEAILQPQAPLFDPLSTPAPGAEPAPAAPPQVPVVPVAPIAPVQPQPPAEPQVPLHVLLDERKERQAYQRQIQQFIEAQQRASQPQPEPVDINDPVQFANAVARENERLRQEMRTIATNMPAHITEHLVRDKFGDEAVDDAVKAAHEAGLGNHFMGQKNPYKALMEWRNTQTIAQQIGPDLKAWETKKEQEIEARVLARLQQAQAAPARPGVPQNLPPSLSTAARANAAGPVVMDSHDFFKNMLKKA